MKTLEVLDAVLRGKRLKAESKRHYRDALTSLANFSEDWPAEGSVINEWLASLDSYSDITTRMWFYYILSAGRFMKKVYKIDNPVEDVERPKVAKRKRRYFSAEDLWKIITACLDTEERALVLTLVDSTCRIGELVGLLGSKIGEGFISVQGKTGERRYRLDPYLCAVLKQMAGGEDMPVFRDREGKACTASALKQRVRRIIKRAGITGAKLGPHTLRHSGASLVAKETGSALAVKALLQHDSIDTSMEYIHDAEDEIKQQISPLRLVGEKVFGEGFMGFLEPKQLTMGGEQLSGESSEVESEYEVVEDDVLIEEMFSEVGEGLEIRPLLKSKDLRLIRTGFVALAKADNIGTNTVRARELMKRMLRRVK